jgi:hypothetical protein
MDDAYAAGLFDGEGYVRCAVWHKPNSTHVRYQVIAGIGVTYRPVIEALQEKYGGSLNENRHDLRNPNNRIQFTWHIASQTAAAFFRLVLPHLIIKREQVELALRLQESIDAHPRLANQYKVHPDRDRIREERALLAAEIKRLKKVAYPSLVDSGPIESVNGH